MLTNPHEIERIVVEGLSISNATWNTGICQLQDLQKVPGAFESHPVFWSALPPLAIYSVVHACAPRVIQTNTIQYADLEDDDGGSLEFCEIPLVNLLRTTVLDRPDDQYICTLKLPSRRSTHYWARKGCTAFISQN